MTRPTTMKIAWTKKVREGDACDGFVAAGTIVMPPLSMECLSSRQILTDPVAATISGHKLSMYWCLAGDQCNGDGQMLVEFFGRSENDCWRWKFELKKIAVLSVVEMELVLQNWIFCTAVKTGTPLVCQIVPV